MKDVYLLLGSNLGNRLNSLDAAKTEITRCIGAIKKQSSIYETEPWGFEDDRFFVNQVVKVRSELGAAAVLKQALAIETRLGRKRIPGTHKSRTIDIDILLYDNLVINTSSLTVPHPHLHRRRFALTPLNEITGTLMHPKFRKTIAELLGKCSDQHAVHLLGVPG